MQYIDYNTYICLLRKLVSSTEVLTAIEFNSFELPPFSNADKNVFIETLE